MQALATNKVSGTLILYIILQKTPLKLPKPQQTTKNNLKKAESFKEIQITNLQTPGPDADWEKDSPGSQA